MGTRILYIEDNPTSARLVRKMLRNTEYDFLQASNGHEALHIVETERPDLILMDVNLPGINGLEVTRIIKQSPTLQHIPVIALTSNVNVQDRNAAFDAGCDEFLTKPISRSVLLDTIANFVLYGFGD